MFIPSCWIWYTLFDCTQSNTKRDAPHFDKSLMQYGVEEASDTDMDLMAIITGRGKRDLVEHFDISYEQEYQIKGSSKEVLLKNTRDMMDKCTFTFTRQTEMLGLGHAILKGELLIVNEPFGVILADVLCVNEEGDNVLAQLV